jgi:ABC-type glycerol-3-phosphate transport system substrate-binding protein
VAPYASKIAPFKLSVSKQMGKTVGIPWDICPVFLIYNMDIINQAGVDVSKIVTHDDLIAAAQQIKAKVPTCKTPIGFGADQAHAQMQVEAMVWQQHSAMLDAKGHLNIMAQEYTNAFQYLEKAVKAGVMAPPYLFQTPSLYNTWIKGQVAMIIFADWWSHWNAAGLKPLVGKIGLAKQPVFTPGKDSPFSIMGGSSYVVPLKAKNPEAGAVFGTFQLFEPAALKLGDASLVYSAVLPAAEALWPDVQLDALRHKELLSSSVPEHNMLVKAALGAPATYRYPPWYSQAFPYYSPHVLSLVRGKISAAQAQQQIYNDVLNKVVKRFTGA